MESKSVEVHVPPHFAARHSTACFFFCSVHATVGRESLRLKHDERFKFKSTDKSKEGLAYRFLAPCQTALPFRLGIPATTCTGDHDVSVLPDTTTDLPDGGEPRVAFLGRILCLPVVVVINSTSFVLSKARSKRHSDVCPMKHTSEVSASRSKGRFSVIEYQAFRYGRTTTAKTGATPEKGVARKAHFILSSILPGGYSSDES